MAACGVDWIQLLMCKRVWNMSPEELSLTDRLRSVGVTPWVTESHHRDFYLRRDIIEYVTHSLARVGVSISRRVSAVERLEAEGQVECLLSQLRVSLGVHCSGVWTLTPPVDCEFFIGTHALFIVVFPSARYSESHIPKLPPGCPST